METPTVKEIQNYINYYKDDNSELGQANLTYYKTMLAYSKELTDVNLRNAIKQKLNVNHIGGSYSQKEVSKVLGIPIGKVNIIENKVIRLLKHPNMSKTLKKYVNEGV